MNHRKVRDERRAKNQMTKLEVTMYLPEKYLLVDLETGDVWRGTEGGSWERAKATTKEVGAAVLHLGQVKES